MVSEEKFNRLYWHSRRGMLELDLILMPFVQNHFKALNPEDQEKYEQLLSCEDQDLFAWFLNKNKPETPELASIVELILERHIPAE